jgi:Permuted papain-like amidase enzyme, YaeF/YiiX, C92 family
MENKISRYEEVRLQIKNGDVIMYKGKKILPRLIRWLTKSSYSHAGIAVWWNERLMVMEAVMKGVRVAPLSRNIYQHKGNVEWFSCKKEISEGDRLRMVIFAQEELGKSYARWKTVLFGVKVLFKGDLSKKDELRMENKLFCSQYVAQIYNSIGLDLKKNREDRFMSPGDIARSPLLDKRGEFKIRNDSIDLRVITKT